MRGFNWGRNTVLHLPELRNVAVKAAGETMASAICVDLERRVAGLLLHERTQADEDCAIALWFEYGKACHHARVIDFGPQVLEGSAVAGHDPNHRCTPRRSKETLETRKRQSVSRLGMLTTPFPHQETLRKRSKRPVDSWESFLALH